MCIEQLIFCALASDVSSPLNWESLAYQLLCMFAQANEMHNCACHLVSFLRGSMMALLIALRMKVDMLGIVLGIVLGFVLVHRARLRARICCKNQLYILASILFNNKRSAMEWTWYVPFPSMCMYEACLSSYELDSLLLSCPLLRELVLSTSLEVDFGESSVCMCIW